MDALAREVQGLRISLAQKEEKRGGLEGRVNELRQELTEIANERATAQEQIESYRRRRAEAEELLAADRAKVLDLRLLAAREQRELEAMRGVTAQLREQQRQTETEIRARREKLDGVQDELNRQRIAENEHAVRLGTLEERIRQEYDVVLSAAPAPTAEAAAMPATDGTAAPASADEASKPAERDWEAVKNEIAQLTEQLRHIGPVNLEAIQEQDELEAAITFRVQQRDDLLAAEKELKELIQRLNHISRERFQTTFDQIRENFREIFRKIFGGGRADVYLEEGVEDALEAGIEIVASPPEKELRSISLLSGGEKTMTTIALLFAIFKTKPSPFCILDEVDAALDEANIGRFAAMLKEFLKDSQFIIVTHSKRTMSIADVMYGITMEEKGVSKKVAVRLDQTAELVA